MVLHRWLVLVVASAGFLAAGDRVGAEEASGLGQPSNQIGLVHDHKPVKYAGHVRMSFAASDAKLTEGLDRIARFLGA